MAFCSSRAAGSSSAISAAGTLTWMRHRPVGAAAPFWRLRSAAEVGSGMVGGTTYSPATSYL